jgi:asparagine synthase (glutamine-hydrolysing)
MCGIAGIWNHKSERPVDRTALRRITRILAHRGPDGEGFYADGALGLGHRRLSIIDIEGGHQPMSNEDGTIWIVFNGEIYNYKDLRSRLIAAGHIFRTNSDTETIVHLYEEFGEECFEKLRGMFAMAIWDRRKQHLLLARDRIGIKPVFYGITHQGVVFGSEIKCIAQSQLMELQIDPTAISDLFTFFYIPGPKTIYKNVFSLSPGSYLRISSEGFFRRSYWDIPEGGLKLPQDGQYEEALLATLRESVGLHLVSDVEVGAFLSGGVDSSSVVSLMASLSRQQVRTFTVGFQEQEYNESSRAREAAKHVGTLHNELTIEPDPAKLFERLTSFYDQPFPDHSSIPTYYVSSAARKAVKVVLSGDGGDEVFAGYSRYRRHTGLERIRRAVPRHLLVPFRPRIGNRENNDLRERLGRVLHQTAIGARDGYLHGITVTDAALRNKLFSGDLKTALSGYDPLDSFRDIFNRAPGSDFLSKLSYLDLKTYLVDDVLTKVDRASMANSLEVRVPLLDHKVVELGLALPEELKLRDGQGKHLLRRTMAPFLPRDFFNAKKMGFRIPFSPWLTGPLRSWAEKAICQNLAKDDLLNPAGVREIWTSFQGGGSHLGDVLGVLLSFGLFSQSSKNVTMCSDLEFVHRDREFQRPAFPQVS